MDYINESYKISIIITLYNCKEYIIDSVKSVESQTHKNWELIIVDDCSTDGSFEIIQEYLNFINDNRIKLIKNDKNIGCYCSVNEGILVSTGDFITRLDSDDKFKPTKLEKQLDYLLKNPNKMAVVCYFLREGAYPDVGDVTIMFKKQVINDIGYYDSVRFGADSEFYWRIGKYYNQAIGKINETLYLAKKRPNSLTTSKITGNAKIRQDYVSCYHPWQDESKRKKKLYMYYPLLDRPFKVNPIMLP